MLNYCYHLLPHVATLVHSLHAHGAPWFSDMLQRNNACLRQLRPRPSSARTFDRSPNNPTEIGALFAQETAAQSKSRYGRARASRCHSHSGLVNVLCSFDQSTRPNRQVLTSTFLQWLARHRFARPQSVAGPSSTALRICHASSGQASCSLNADAARARDVSSLVNACQVPATLRVVPSQCFRVRRAAGSRYHRCMATCDATALA